MKKILVTLLVGAMLLMATSAMATSISGNVSFVGDLLLLGPADVTASTATGIDFQSAIVLGGKSGDYVSVANYTPVTFTDFYFNPSSLPVANLWSFSYGSKTYSFDLLTVAATNVPSNTLSLNGSGVLSITGFDATPGTWSFTTQDGASGNLTFSAASAVPEPATLLLLGSGLVGLAFLKRRKA